MPTYRNGRLLSVTRRGRDGAGAMYDADQYAAALITEGLADSTIRNYRCLYQRWIDWCITEDHSPADPNPHTVRAWSRTVHGSRAMLAQAAAMISHLCRIHDIENLSSCIPVPREPRRASKALDADKAAKLEAHAHTAGLAGSATLLGLYTAARRSEIAGMQWKYVTITEEKGRLGGSLTFWRPKNRDWHTVPLNPVLAQHLQARHTSEQWLFPGRHGGHVAPAQIWRWCTKVAEDAGVGHVTPHVWRHTCLSMANDESGDLRATMDLAGHTSPEVTARYTRVGGQRLQNVVNMLDYRNVS